MEAEAEITQLRVGFWDADALEAEAAAKASRSETAVVSNQLLVGRFRLSSG
jgi:hypothetical protein